MDLQSGSHHIIFLILLSLTASKTLNALFLKCHILRRSEQPITDLTLRAELLQTAAYPAAALHTAGLQRALISDWTKRLTLKRHGVDRGEGGNDEEHLVVQLWLKVVFLMISNQNMSNLPTPLEMVGKFSIVRVETSLKSLM